MDIPAYCQRIAGAPGELAATGSNRLAPLLFIAIVLLILGATLRAFATSRTWLAVAVPLLMVAGLVGSAIEPVSAQTPTGPPGYSVAMGRWLEAQAAATTTTTTVAVSPSTSTAVAAPSPTSTTTSSTTTTSTTTTTVPVLTDFSASIGALSTTLALGGDAVLQIALQEVLGGEASGPVTVRVNRPSLLLHPATNVAPPFSGSGWAFVSSNSAFYTFAYTYPGSAANAGSSILTITLPVNPSAPTATLQPATAAISLGSGGDSDTANNLANVNLLLP